MKDQGEATDVTVFWVDCPEGPGWYAEVKGKDGEICEDSRKVWFPLEVDNYGAHEGETLLRDLRREYPNASILIQGDEYSLMTN